MTLVSGSPFVKGLARKAEVSAGLGDAPGHVTGLPQQLQTPGNHSVLFVLVHGLSPGSRREPECHLRSGTSQKIELQARSAAGGQVFELYSLALVRYSDGRWTK